MCKLCDKTGTPLSGHPSIVDIYTIYPKMLNVLPFTTLLKKPWILHVRDTFCIVNRICKQYQFSGHSLSQTFSALYLAFPTTYSKGGSSEIMAILWSTTWLYIYHTSQKCNESPWVRDTSLQVVGVCYGGVPLYVHIMSIKPQSLLKGF